MVDWNRENQTRGGQDRWCLKLYTKATNQHQPGRRRGDQPGEGGRELSIHKVENTCGAGHQEGDDQSGEGGGDCLIMLFRAGRLFLLSHPHTFSF